jgi:amino-acid N-acetyltransferase
MHLQLATDGDRGRIEPLLEANGLPHQDPDSSPVELYAGYADGQFVGAGGLERYGRNALLRSLVVPDDRRGHGHGTALSRALESAAVDAGVERLYLLTDGAADFFAALGFETIDREEAPNAIRQTAEFRRLCGDDATCMRRHIG